MKLILGRDADITAWVAKQLGQNPDDEFGPCRAIGMELDGQIIGGVVYSHYREQTRDIQLSIAATSPKWATRGTIAALLAYPFVTLQCNRATVVVRKRNRRSRKLAEGLGFRLEGTLRQGFLDDDMLILGILREEAEQWLTRKD